MTVKTKAQIAAIKEQHLKQTIDIKTRMKILFSKACDLNELPEYVLKESDTEMITTIQGMNYHANNRKVPNADFSDIDIDSIVEILLLNQRDEFISEIEKLEKLLPIE
jgi:hypothetical protein